MAIERTFRDLAEDDEEQRQIIAAQLGRLGGLTWENVLQSKRVLLVSEAGVGKTYECQQQAQRLWDDGKPAFYLDLAGLKDCSLMELLDPEQEARFEQWRSAQSDIATFFLDSIDELELTLGKFDTALARFAKPLAGNLGRVRVVVTSRPIPINQETFRRRLPIPPVTEPPPTAEDFADIAMQKQGQSEEPVQAPDWRNIALLPLTDEQIREMAAIEGVTDLDAFVADIGRREAQEFARRPQDLIELCADWHARQHIRTHADQVATNIAVKLRPRTDRPEKSELSEAKALEGAQRLALAMLLSRTLTIRHSAAADTESTDGAALEPAKILLKWNANERATLLERALFGFATYGRVRFHHRSVIEFLAAEELYRRLERGMPRASVHRLLFAVTAQGETVVRPSMRPVAAWLARRRDDIFERVRDTEPNILLDFGDPESLPMARRKQALRAYVTRYGKGGWRGLELPHLQVHRFASEDLGPEIKALWEDSIENTEVRQLLLRLIGEGKISTCADIAYDVAMMPTEELIERVFALDALIALGDHRLSAICDSVEIDRELWPTKIDRIALDRLFPTFMSAEQLCRALTGITQPRKTIGELSYHIPGTIASAEIDLQQLEALRAGIHSLVVPGIRWDDKLCCIRAERRDLIQIFTSTCLRNWQDAKSFDAALIDSTVRALRLHSRDDVGRDEQRKALREILQSQPAPAREAIFWADYEFYQSTCPEKSHWRTFHEIGFDGHLDLTMERDWQWLCTAVGDAARPTQERHLALEAALLLYRRAEPPQQAELVEELRQLTDGEEILAKEIDDAMRGPNTKFLEAQAEREREKEAREVQAAKDHQSWVDFWQEVADNPDTLFSDERSGKTIWNLWKVMSRQGQESRASGWNRRFMEGHFGKDTADRMRQALMKYWRADVPTIRSERPQGEKGTYPIRWQVGLAGVYAEAEDPEWANILSDDEVQIATRYAPIELNGFPSWLDGLVQAYPDVVDAIIGTELSEELNAPLEPNNHSMSLQNVSHAPDATVKLLLPRVMDWFREKAEKFSHNESANAAATRLSQVIEFLLNHGDASVRDEICAKAEQVIAASPHRELLGIWLPVLLSLKPEKGVPAFEAIISPLPVERNGEAVAWFSALFGRHGRSGADLRSEGFTPKLILRLLRLSYIHVQIADDTRHEGVFSPDARDDAESARNNILEALLSFGGKDGWDAKIAMANDPLASHFRERLIALANGTAAREADGEPFSDQQLAALDEFGEAPPATPEAMFALMCDRLDDLDDLLLQDTSPRELWATIDDERVMRRAISHELRNMSNACYTVDQEAVTADEKETDIRLRSTISSQQATIELKVGERGWSASVLRDKLRTQLVDQYMAAEDCRAGCMLITVATDRHWQHPETNERMGFDELITLLCEEAEKIVQEFGGSIRLMVKGLDLRPRLKK